MFLQNASSHFVTITHLFQVQKQTRFKSGYESPHQHKDVMFMHFFAYFSGQCVAHVQSRSTLKKKKQPHSFCQWGHGCGFGSLKGETTHTDNNESLLYFGYDLGHLSLMDTCPLKKTFVFQWLNLGWEAKRDEWVGKESTKPLT